MRRCIMQITRNESKTAVNERMSEITKRWHGNTQQIALEVLKMSDLTIIRYDMRFALRRKPNFASFRNLAGFR